VATNLVNSFPTLSNLSVINSLFGQDANVNPGCQ